MLSHTAREMVLPGFPVQQAVMLIADTLARERVLARAVELVERVCRLGDGFAEAFAPAAPLACRACCPFCCSTPVIVSAVEVVRLVDWLRENVGSAEMAEIAGRLQGVPAAGNGKRHRYCPLLENGRCLAYPARPFVCRGANSFDARQCERAFRAGAEGATIPAYQPQLHLWHSLRTGIANGLAALGYPRDVLLLSEALQIALSQPGAPERWLAGEDVFAPAARRPGDL